MAPSMHCPYCSAQIEQSDPYCKNCGANLKRLSENEAGDIFNDPARQPPVEEDWSVPKEDFSELDGKPKGKPGCLPLILVVLVLVIMVAVGVVVLRDGSGELPLEDETGLDDPAGDEAVEEDAREEPEEGAEEEAEDGEDGGEEGEEAELPGDEAAENDDDEEKENENAPPGPDHALPEEELAGWIKERVDDPNTIVLSHDELGDIDEFFEQYDENDNVIVYQIESTDDQFTSVLLGVPFREWSIRAVFQWNARYGEWRFLREDSVR